MTGTKPSKIGLVRVGTHTVLAPKGSLTVENFEALESMFDELPKQPKMEIVLDLKDVPFMDSTALELLVRLDDELKEQGSALKLANLNDICRDILYATRLINIFLVYEDIQKAVRSDR